MEQQHVTSLSTCDVINDKLYFTEENVVQYWLCLVVHVYVIKQSENLLLNFTQS